MENPFEGFSQLHKDFEKIAVDELRKDADIYLVDEIGEKMFYSDDM